MIDKKKQEKQLIAIEIARQYIEKGEEIPIEISKILFPPKKENVNCYTLVNRVKKKF